MTFVGQRERVQNLEIVQFVVGDQPQKLKEEDQARFVIRKGWLKPENVLSWKQIKKLTKPDSD